MQTSPISLNPKQQEAVLHKDGPLLILAGAGSGKTRVLVERMIHLIRHHHISPWKILAVTFTNKAAQEMKHRVMEQLGPSADRLWISTFHSSCLRILRRHAELIGYNNQFVVYDDTDQRTLIKKILKEKDYSDKIYKPKSIQYHINKSKNEAIGPENFPTDGDFYLTKIQDIYTLYQEQLRLNQAMDFGDLIVNVIELFKKHPEILAEYHNQFHYVMVDEYQDTNICQYKLIAMLTDKWKNICVVGDDDQSIYKFRGAEIRNILDFQKDYPQAVVIRLEQNYRSTKNILHAANYLIKTNQGRMGKQLWTENQSGEKIYLYAAQTETDEARCVVGKISDLRKEYKLSDMAIFYRTNAQSRSFEDEFRKQKVPYKIFGGIRFYDRAEIKDMMAYLKVLINPSDSISLKRVINMPSRGLGSTTLQKIEVLSLEKNLSFWDSIKIVVSGEIDVGLNGKTRTKLESFISLIDQLNQARLDMPLDEFMTFLYEETGYWKMLLEEKTIEAEGRQENLTEFVNVVEEYLESIKEGNLEGFLDQISLASDIDNMEEEGQYITLMTIHLAKGLEFPIVFLVGLEEGLFPHARSFDNEEDIEEERRLCYVGMTRAMKLLHISFAKERKLFGAPQYNFPSRFLEELPEDLLETVGMIPERTVPLGTFSSHPSRAFPQSTQKKPFSSTERVIDLEYTQLSSPIRRGMRVRHAIFGVGLIERLEGNDDNQKVTVKFNSGIQKKLSMKHANLTILS